MKKVFKYLGYALILVVVVIAGALTYVKVALPNVGQAEEIKIEYTPERIERGKYLATSVTVCVDCHSKRDWSRFSGPLTPGTLGQGGERFDQSVGMPGVFISKNITPHGIARYTDGELYRVITTGVTKEGKAMFPLMPYPYYARMDREDIYSIIAYVRSIAPIENKVEDSQPDFPMNFIINTIPQAAAPQTRPDKSDQLAYGSYLVNAASCAECHTQVDKGRIKPELIFAGGREFLFPDGSTVRSSNITPDQETGLGKWTEEMFIQKFKHYTDSTHISETIKPGEFNSIMPWTMYGTMENSDLAAIFAYLKSVKPLTNKVVRFSPAK